MIKNIIFDLGHVLLDLDFDRAEQRFKQLFQEDFDAIYYNLHEEGHFLDYELGKIDEAEFTGKLRAASKKPISEQDIIDAWNSMLLRIHPKRIEMLRELNQQYNVYLLSNTNATHIKWVGEHLEQEHQLDLTVFEQQLFKKPYYSHVVNMRKPDVEIYEFVLADADLKGEETLFIDDREDNIEAAKKVGILGYHHQIKDDIAEVMDRVLEGISLK